MPTIIFGSAGVGEVIQYSSLIKRVFEQGDAILAITEWQLPFFERAFPRVIGFEQKDYRLYRDNGRKLALSPAAAERLGVPGNPWMFPLGDSVLINGEPIPNEIKRFDVPQLQQPIGEKLLHDYGFDSSDLGFYTSPLLVGKYPELTVAICNSAEASRRLSPEFMNRIMASFKGVRFIFVGSPYEESLLVSDNPIMFRWSVGRLRKTISDCYKAILASDLIVATDCGWAYVGLANRKPALVVQTRAIIESLVPPQFWGRLLRVDRLVEPKCKRECSAQKFMMAGKMDQEFNPNWFDPKLMTRDWLKNVHNAKYPKSMECFERGEFPCMDYSDKEFERFIEKMIILKPELSAFRV